MHQDLAGQRPPCAWGRGRQASLLLVPWPPPCVRSPATLPRPTLPQPLPSCLAASARSRLPCRPPVPATPARQAGRPSRPPPRPPAPAVPAVPARSCSLSLHSFVPSSTSSSPSRPQPLVDVHHSLTHRPRRLALTRPAPAAPVRSPSGTVRRASSLPPSRINSIAPSRLHPTAESPPVPSPSGTRPHIATSRIIFTPPLAAAAAAAAIILQHIAPPEPRASPAAIARPAYS